MPTSLFLDRFGNEIALVKAKKHLNRKHSSIINDTAVLPPSNRTNCSFLAPNFNRIYTDFSPNTLFGNEF